MAGVWIPLKTGARRRWRTWWCWDGLGTTCTRKSRTCRWPRCGDSSRYAGGSSANIAVGLARLGASVGMISSLGTDALSDFLVDFLSREHVGTAHVQWVPGFLPSLSLTEVSPPSRFPQVFYRHDAVDTMLVAGEADLSYVDGARMFVTNGTSLCASPSRESTYRALERARRSGCRVVLDVDFRAMSWPSEVGGGAGRATGAPVCRCADWQRS